MIVILGMVVTRIVVRKLNQILIGILLPFIVKLNKNFFYTNISKNHLCVTDHIFWIRVVGHFQLQAPNVGITTQSPKMSYMNRMDSLILCYLKKIEK